MPKPQLRANLLLLLAALIWGLAFVAQRVGIKYVGSFTFNGVRFALGSLSLLPLLWYSNRKTPSPIGTGSKNKSAPFPPVYSSVACSLPRPRCNKSG